MDRVWAVEDASPYRHAPTEVVGGGVPDAPYKPQAHGQARLAPTIKHINNNLPQKRRKQKWNIQTTWQTALKL